MSVPYRYITMIAATVALWPHVIQAQQRPTASRTGAALSSPPARVAVIGEDSAMYAVGHVTFARYTTPGLCLAAARNTRDVMRRSVAQQQLAHTLRETLEQDTLPGEVTTVARTCGAHLTVANTKERDLPDLFELALVMQRDGLARDVATRRVALASTPNVRDSIQQEVIHWYLMAQPARIAAAEAAIKQLDSLGRPALITRMHAYVHLLEFANSKFDRVRIRQTAENIIAMGRLLTSSELQWGQGGSDFYQAYHDLASLAFVDAPDSLAAIAQRAKQDLANVSLPDMIFGNFNFRTASLDRTIANLLIFTGGEESIGGRVVGRLQATYWSPTGRDTVQPVSGKVTLFVWGESGGFSRGGWTMFNPFRVYDHYLWIERIHQWGAKYSPANLAMTVVSPTLGYSLLDGPQAPAAEAQTLSWFYKDYLKLPVTLAIQETPFTRIPLPDGRRQNDLRAYWDKYQWRLDEVSTRVVLAGRDGKLLYAGAITPLFEALLAREMVAAERSMPGVPSSTVRPTTTVVTPRASSTDSSPHDSTP